MKMTKITPIVGERKASSARAVMESKD